MDEKAYYHSPIGIIELTGSNAGISSLYFVDDYTEKNHIPANLRACVKQLDEYFKKKRKIFELKLNPDGTEFQKTVWNKLQDIPYGKAVSYLEIAKSLGNKNATRAVGNANGKNKISVIIPCHRVIGINGKLTGYAGGLKRKKWLLDFENSSKQTSLFD
ncbi:MAG: cysteine methyltransferase [Flavobacteriales bacterium]|nr:MAG: cysteine methyltransferase [Flavobacteriales bacterium]